ncbi:MAG: 50S ribosomal protein L22 [Candidatus Marinimicrobia bacterium]|jgi:large subunit ribosomal protein L22|nr:50S ribosomal protein L22 [Candidatus Neomarinimicrobiota bacterium]MBT3936223.1 50S ribosomal protein L22 [Candidatus Neomarinimicrobiota bacterium]MBT4383989.1 50S ribosomal protein L22 [Candidatus Neomarinimicrobiota bacterium]MBT4635028.1 50S ribosomal protein L22 [Candidatus Neomarinimicrobiota bacterium]MBT4685622.1 50S ribosomal protein L22 [Candidatus Neomarinimicrobiota bacterium]
MKAKAIATNVHQSPRKMRKTLNSIRGLKVGDAMNMLHFSPEKAASIIEKTLRSAVANLMQKMDDTHLDPETLGIDEAFVNGGPVMKRFRAASMGRAARLRRPTSHLTIVVTDDQ